MLKPMELKKSRETLLREEFAAVGPMTTQAFARHCIDMGFWDEDELTRFALSHAQSEIRKALNTPDASGLRFAGPTTNTEDGAPLWSQRALWRFEDYTLNCGDLVRQRDALHDEAVKLARECRDRFGVAPDIDWPTGSLFAAD